MVLTVEIWAEDGAYNAYCPELDVATYGTSPEHAHSMLKEAVEGVWDERLRSSE